MDAVIWNSCFKKFNGLMSDVGEVENGSLII